MKRNRFTCTLALLIVFGLLAACGAPASGTPAGSAATGSANADAAPSSANADAAPAASAAGTTPIVDATFVGTMPEIADDFAKAAIDRALGIDLRLSMVGAPEDYASQLSLRVVGGTPPDLIGVNRTSLAQYAKQGQVLDLTPYLADQLKPTADFVGQDSLRKGTIDGKIYGLARRSETELSQWSLWIRKDWLDNLGLQPPTTTDELLAVATAFAKSDPDGNGQNDTFGYTGHATNLRALAPLFGAFGVGEPGTFYLENGQLTNAFYDPAMPEALAYVRALREAGALDPELSANTGTQVADKAKQGVVGIVYATWPTLKRPSEVEAIKAVNPEAEWIQLAPPKGPNGDQFDGTFDLGASGRMFAVPRALEAQPDKLQKVFELLNFVSGGDGLQLVQYGLEDQHFRIEDGTVVKTDKMDTEAGFTWIYQFTGRPERAYLAVKFPEQQEYIDFAAEQPRIETFNGFVTPPDGYNLNDAVTYSGVQLLGFINGERPLEQYQAFLEELGGAYSYQTYRDAAQSQLTELGLIK